MISKLLNDNVSIQKKNGELIENIKAAVTSNEAVIEGNHILIESGDLLLRHASNGSTETYQVIDPGFHEGLGSIKPGYVIKHKNLSVPEAEKAIQNITYNMHGSQARVNNHSTDNSINKYIASPDVMNSIEELRSEIRNVVSSNEEKQEALELVDSIESQFHSEKPSKAVISTLLSALPAAGSVASIGSFLLAALSG